jgi:hypothetical protein
VFTLLHSLLLLSNFFKESVFETKGGCVQAIQFQDLTKFGGQDLIVGDSDGGITVFSNSEILSKRTLSSSVTNLVIDNDLVGNSSILAGDRNGVITALKPHELLWRVKLGEDPNCLHEPSLGIPLDLSIRCLLPLKIVDKFGILSRLLLVTTTNSNKLHLYNQGTRVLTVSAPSSITAVSSSHHPLSFPLISSIQLSLRCSLLLLNNTSSFFLFFLLFLLLSMSCSLPFFTVLSFLMFSGL